MTSSPTPTPTTVDFDWRGLTLVGSLHLPAGAGPHAVVLMSQGSGPADRDSGGYFPPIRDALLERGVATFAFDKPGCGESDGDWRDFGLADRASQLLAALDLLTAHPSIDADRVGVYGHSQGGWLVHRMARRQHRVAFGVASSAPTIDVREQLAHDVEHTVRGAGHDEAEVAAARRLAVSLAEAATAGVDLGTVTRDLLDPARRRPWFDELPDVGDEAEWRLLSTFLREEHDPVADLRSVDVPFLAVYGGHDILLPPWRGAEESGRALDDAPTDDATVVVFPTGDHRLQLADPTAFVDGYLDLLGDWVSVRARN